MRIQYCSDVESVFLLSNSYMGVLVISVRIRISNARILHAWTINKRTMVSTPQRYQLFKFLLYSVVSKKIWIHHARDRDVHLPSGLQLFKLGSNSAPAGSSPSQWTLPHYRSNYQHIFYWEKSFKTKFLAKFQFVILSLKNIFNIEFYFENCLEIMLVYIFSFSSLTLSFWFLRIQWILAI